MQSESRPGRRRRTDIPAPLGAAAIVATVANHARDAQECTPRAGGHSWRWRRPLAGLLLAGSALFGGTAGAEEPPAVAPVSEVPAAAVASAGAPVSSPTFVIEKITVEGMRHGSARIVAAETLLAIGQAYTEKQLQQALHRVERLPFVVEADFALRKGTERGCFELVITIVETKPVFSGGELRVAGYGGPRLVGGWPGRLAPELGGRLFLGGQSEVSITVRSPMSGYLTSPPGLSGVAPGVEIRYRHHNLFGRHLVGGVSLGAGAGFGRELDHVSRELVWSLSSHGYKGSADLALPLSRVSILKGGLSWTRDRSDLEFEANESRSSYWSASLTWQSDTSDDPFTPREGRRIEATLSHTWGGEQTTPRYAYGAPNTIRLREDDLSDSSAALSGIWFWPLSTRLSLGAGASMRAADRRESNWDTTWAGTEWQSSPRVQEVAGQLEVTLLGNLRSRPGAATHCWWELQGLLSRGGAEGEWSTSTSDSPWTAGTWSSRATDATVGLVLAVRGRWGVARFRVTYSHRLSSIFTEHR